jgi:hypothetical protein
MHVFRHDVESDASTVLILQLFSQRIDDNFLRNIVIEQSSPLVTRKRDEVGVAFFVIDFSIVHDKAKTKDLLCLRHPDTKLSGLPGS